MKKKEWEDYPPPRRMASGCLRWRGPHHSNGYGRMGRNRYAHRVAWEREHGRPVPEGMEIDHVAERGCIHRDCVEPSHLEAVTHVENLRRGKKIGGQLARTHCPSGHPYSGENLIVRRGKRECRTCVYDRNKRAHARRALARSRP